MSDEVDRELVAATMNPRAVCPPADERGRVEVEVERLVEVVVALAHSFESTSRRARNRAGTVTMTPQR